MAGGARAWEDINKLTRDERDAYMRLIEKLQERK